MMAFPKAACPCSVCHGQYWNPIVPTSAASPCPSVLAASTPGPRHHAQARSPYRDFFTGPEKAGDALSNIGTPWRGLGNADKTAWGRPRRTQASPDTRPTHTRPSPGIPFGLPGSPSTCVGATAINGFRAQRAAKATALELAEPSPPTRRQSPGSLLLNRYQSHPRLSVTTPEPRRYHAATSP